MCAIYKDVRKTCYWSHTCGTTKHPISAWFCSRPRPTWLSLLCTWCVHFQNDSWM